MNNRTALVTGGRRGIGAGIARRLAATGFDIVVLDLVQDEAAERLADDIIAAGARCKFVRADIAAVDQHATVLDTAWAAFGGIDCLVNNAGIAPPVRGDLLELAAENFDRVVAVNLRGTVFLTQGLVRRMLAQPATGAARCIINVTSVSAELASTERLDYCIAKAGLSMFSKALALRLAADAIAVFEVRPGIIRTHMTSAAADKYQRLIDDGVVPARRWGEADDVGRIVAGLASGEFAFASGSVINADGALALPRL
ncbi:MAG: 3-ketoacyl-ACP reductase [Gammaproteobacteria bacterium]|nr:3-ketoacyl-ACP reductase [Gammaproteobacteria bacterium]